MSNIIKEEGLKFLLLSYFGATAPTIEDYANRAYRDLCRTLSGIGAHGKKKEWRVEMTSIIKEAINNQTQDYSLSEDRFNCWHKNTCDKLIELSKNFLGNSDITFSYGHAQKWLNMTLKYQMMFDESFNSESIELMHVPVDNYIIKGAYTYKLVNPCQKYKIPWSQWSKETYVEFQKELRDKLDGKSPIEWELEAWIAEAKLNKWKKVNERTLY